MRRIEIRERDVVPRSKEEEPLTTNRHEIPRIRYRPFSFALNTRGNISNQNGSSFPAKNLCRKLRVLYSVPSSSGFVYRRAACGDLHVIQQLQTPRKATRSANHFVLWGGRKHWYPRGHSIPTGKIPKYGNTAGLLVCIREYRICETAFKGSHTGVWWVCAVGMERYGCLPDFFINFLRNRALRMAQFGLPWDNQP
jgi:hypothetical protein